MTDRIIRERDTGKTKELLDLCSRNNGIFVCKHPERVVEKCLAYRIPIVKCMGYQELAHDGLDKNEKYYIDELERFVRETSELNIKGFTLTNED